ncbi:DASH complex subunit SPC19 [Candida viswanathii]|uniref:DASH complex subunit SPC19 n=1 Tax=Candida viswanathii TaxID=5486 RepID=A0A367XSD3_9ASCO|nr:DASH complex subunit SPC19 [Candida viswanathii]
MTEQDQHPRFNNLENCTNSLRESIDILKRSNQLLDDTLQGSSRLTKILSTRKVFDLIPELDLNDAKRNFANNINPQITDNMDRLQHELVKLSNQKNDLTSQLKQLKARTKEYDNKTTKRRKIHALSDGDIESLLSSPNVHENYDIGKIRQLQVLRDKKNRLKYTLSRMN